MRKHFPGGLAIAMLFLTMIFVTMDAASACVYYGQRSRMTVYNNTGSTVTSIRIVPTAMPRMFPHDVLGAGTIQPHGRARLRFEHCPSVCHFDVSVRGSGRFWFFPRVNACRPIFLRLDNSK